MTASRTEANTGNMRPPSALASAVTSTSVDGGCGGEGRRSLILAPRAGGDVRCCARRIRPAADPSWSRGISSDPASQTTMKHNRTLASVPFQPLLVVMASCDRAPPGSASTKGSSSLVRRCRRYGVRRRMTLKMVRESKKIGLEEWFALLAVLNSACEG